MKSTTDRILAAIFCDDIRHEVGNKMSFMGCYQSELVVPTTSIALSKLCIYATAITPVTRPFKSLTFRVVLNDKIELARLEIPAEGLSNHSKPRDKTVTRNSISTALIFSPFVIEEPASLRLMADTEEGEIIGPRLLIKSDSEVAAIPMPREKNELADPKLAVKKPRKKRTQASPTRTV